MILDLKMIPFLSVLLCVVIIQGAYGTFFPEVENPPPIPGRGPSSFYASQDLSQPKEEGIFSADAKPDEERWYYEENQSREIGGRQRSYESFDRYDEVATSHVATPIPDVEPLPQSSNIPKINPTDIRNPRNIFLLQRDADDQYPERWIPLQLSAESLIEDVNQNPGFPVATDTVKSIAAPASFDISPKTQFPSNQAINIVQVRPPNTVELQKIYTNYPRTVGNVPAVKQIVDILQPPPPQLQPQLNTKRVVQQQIINSDPSVALPLPAPAQIASKQSFVVPPPLPPPLKGDNVPSKVISSVPVNIIPDSNAVVSSKNIIPDSNIIPGKNVVQQLRHLWIPTSSKTGKFITIPIAGSINSIANKEFSLDSTPVTISDTWVLKQDGPVPVFEQQKSAMPQVLSPVVQSGKVIFQNPTIVQVDGPPHPIVAKVDSPKQVPVVEKNVASNVPIDIWPAREDLTNPEKYGSYSSIVASGVPPTAVKSNAIIIRKSSELLSAPQKTIPAPIPSQAVQFVNGKPCPLPLAAPQKSIFSPLNDRTISPPRISTQRRLPFARIIRVNRNPTGSYYLLNKSIRPSYFVYPSQAVIQQPKSGLVRLVQTKQLPTYLQREIPAPPVQTKQISIPVQSKQIFSPLTAKQITYPHVSRQVILPVAPSQKSRIIYPTVQTIRYVYPWNAYSSPILGKGPYVPEFRLFKSKRSKSESSSSESSSENSSSEDSSESSKLKKEEKSKKNKSKEEKSKREKVKKEEKSESGENSSSVESEKQTESELTSESKETVSEEKSSEKESEDSLETSDSQSSLKFHRNSNEPGHVTDQNAYINLISSHGSEVGEETHFDEEKST